MATAKRDENKVTTLLGVSSSDGITPIVIWADPTTHRLLVDVAGAGAGDVTGPSSSTDNAIVRFNATTGKVIQDYTSGAPTISDTGVMTLTTALAVTSGGSGVGTFTDHGVLLGSGTSAFSVTGAGTSGQVLTSNGASTDPTFQAAAGGGNVSNTGTPLNNQIAVWTDATTVEGTTGLTYDGANLQLTGDIGSTGTRITKGWFTDLQVTNAIAGSITGNAATVTTITGLAPDTATTQATQPNITSLGTLTTLTVDDITINANTISSAGASTLAITPTTGQVITFDGTITLDAGVIAGATSITSTTFVGALTGQADTVATIAGLAPDTATTQATQAAITSAANLVTVGTLTTGNATAIVDASSVTVAGKVELATTAEIDTGTDSTRAMPVDQFVASKRNIRWLTFNLVEAGTDVAIATNIGGDFLSPIAGTILQDDSTPFFLYATNSTAGTTGTMVVDISIGGTSIMTTNKLDFDTTEKTTTTAATPPDLTTTTLAVGDIITIDIDSIHTTAAKGLTVYMAIRE